MPTDMSSGGLSYSEMIDEIDMAKDTVIELINENKKLKSEIKELERYKNALEIIASAWEPRITNQVLSIIHETYLEEDADEKITDDQMIMLSKMDKRASKIASEIMRPKKMRPIKKWNSRGKRK